MLSLLPATACGIGIVVLGQVPSPVELAGIALVVGGVALHLAGVRRFRRSLTLEGQCTWKRKPSRLETGGPT